MALVQRFSETDVRQHHKKIYTILGVEMFDEGE